MSEWKFEPTLLNGSVNWVAGCGVNSGFNLRGFYKYLSLTINYKSKVNWSENAGYYGTKS